MVLLYHRAMGVSFKRAAKTYLISSNGRLAVKFGLGQPQKANAFISAALSACSVRLDKVWGRGASCVRMCDAALLKETPTALLSKNNSFSSLKFYNYA